VVTVTAASVGLAVVLPAAERPEPGREVGLAFDPETLVFFDGDTNRRIDPVGRPL
jgi:hypothetical protein